MNTKARVQVSTHLRSRFSPEEQSLITDLTKGKTVFIPDATSQEMKMLYNRIVTLRLVPARKLARVQRQVGKKWGYVVWLEPA